MTHAPLSKGPAPSDASVAKHRTRAGMGLTQMSLVEHALCPLDGATSRQRGFVFRPSYFFTDQHRHRKKANVCVTCPGGLSAGDELYLWGLLAITFAQAQPATDFYATPHYCLRQLGFITHHTKKGGNTYQLFRDAVHRLARVNYENDHFYDPLRSEHRDVAFGFFSYSLPLDATSSRAWRFAWDGIFFEFCQASAGALSFDLATYRTLDGASRRLYLLLKKIFWRSESSPAFDLRHLAVNVLGFADSLPTWKLRQKAVRTIEALLDARILMLPSPTSSIADLFTKHAAGEYTVRFHRGPDFDRRTMPSSATLTDSPHYDLLREIGFDDRSIDRILSQFSQRMVAEWCDITLAAKERNGEKFFTSSPQAYFLDNVKSAASGARTPPDWWHELRKAEERKRRDADRAAAKTEDEALNEYLATEGRAAFEQTVGSIFADLAKRGNTEASAREQATHIARMNLRAAFRRRYPQYRDDGPSPDGLTLSL